MRQRLRHFADISERLPRGVVDGGFYTKTRENRPLIGPLHLLRSKLAI